MLSSTSLAKPETTSPGSWSLLAPGPLVAHTCPSLRFCYQLSPSLAPTSPGWLRQAWLSGWPRSGLCLFCSVHCHACPSQQPAGRAPEGALPSTEPEPGMAGARRRAGFGGDRTALPFPLRAGIGDLSCRACSPVGAGQRQQCGKRDRRQVERENTPS